MSPEWRNFSCAWLGWLGWGRGSADRQDESVGAVSSPVLRPQNAAIRALHFGAGNIGRGFIGLLLSEAGCNVVFADVVPQLIETLKERGMYHVKIVGNSEEIREVTIAGAVYSNKDEVFDEVCSADLITTAVGPRVLKIVGKVLAKGLALRRQRGIDSPLNIIACENMVRATSLLKQCVIDEIGADDDFLKWTAANVGFVDCAVDRIVPPVNAEGVLGDPLGVTVEEFSEWIVDETQLTRGPDGQPTLPPLPGMIRSSNLSAFVERKLLTVNTGHAVCAYVGYLMGHEDIRSSILDKKIRPIVEGAMRESGQVLAKRFGFDAELHDQYIKKIIARYENPHLRDEVIRVGRDPQRKLAPGDRLIKPLRGALEYGLDHSNLMIGVAAALMYDYENDPQAAEIQQVLREAGCAAALTKFCQMDQVDVAQEICAIFVRLQGERKSC